MEQLSLLFTRDVVKRHRRWDGYFKTCHQIIVTVTRNIIIATQIRICSIFLNVIQFSNLPNFKCIDIKTILNVEFHVEAIGYFLLVRLKNMLIRKVCENKWEYDCNRLFNVIFEYCK